MTDHHYLSTAGGGIGTVTDPRGVDYGYWYPYDPRERFFDCAQTRCGCGRPLGGGAVGR